MSRRLSPDDLALWDRVRGGVTPLRPAQAIPAPAAQTTAPAPRPSEPPPPVARPALPAFRVGEAAPARRRDDLLPGLAASLAAAPLRMDAGAFARLRRGKLRPEARLDLHGMTLAEAHPALVAFVLGASARGRRLVLVITGKGRARDEEAPMPVREGRLRHDVPRWLALPPLAPVVLQVAPAHRRHGGDGALYVYLRGR